MLRNIGSEYHFFPNEQEPKLRVLCVCVMILDRQNVDELASHFFA